MNRSLSHRQDGLTLVELMVAMALGLILMIGVSEIYISNIKSFRTSENLAVVQENARIAFELMSRDIREAGSTPCGAQIVVNSLNPTPASELAKAWDTVLRGYDEGDDTGAVAIGTGTGARASGTDAILVASGSGANNVKIVDHVVNSAQMKLNTTNHGLSAGDIVMACNSTTASIFQITNIQSNTTAVHNSGTGTPGNCTKGLGYRDPAAPNCTKPLAYLEDFSGGTLVSFSPTLWYIGINDRGGRSLYRFNLRSNASTEVVENVVNLQLTFLMKTIATKALATSFTAPSSTAADWLTSAPSQAVSVRMVLTLQTGDKIDIGDQTSVVQRQFANTVQIRSRETL